MSRPPALSRLVDFDGRSRRREALGVSALCAGLMTAAVLMDLKMGRTARIEDIAGSLTVLALLLLPWPLLATLVRRLHDTGRPGQLVLLAVVPLVGQLLLARWIAAPGVRGANRYGIDPRTEERAPALPALYPFRRA